MNPNDPSTTQGRNRQGRTPEQVASIRENRRLRNIASATRSRNRIEENEPRCLLVQVSENEDKIKALEKEVKKLTDELTGTTPKSKEERPDWWGEPF